MSADRPPSLWRVIFLAEHYGRMILTLDETAEQLGLSPNTIKNWRTRGEFAWLRTDGRTLTADVVDVALFLDRRRAADEASLDRPWEPAAHRAATQRAGTRRRYRPQGKG